uniref:Peroxidase n=1 Tax=Plectus sambesii TaxID=2011161 RepID=A0A914XFH8_9BILA
MARVVCDNSDDIGKIQPEVFMQGDNFGNCPIECNTTVIDRMDLSYWLDSEPKLQLPITREVLDKAVELGRRNARDIKDQESRKGRLQASGSNTPSAQFTHSTLMRPTQESLDIARSAQVLLETTKILVRGEGLEDSEKLPKELDMATLQRLLPEVDVSRLMGNLSALANNNEECVPKDLPCDHTTPYRTYSGWCNNLRFPSYGNAFTPLRRLLDPVYDDGFDEPRKHSVVGDLSLPSARSVSNAIHLDGEATHVKYTHMVMQFGQFLDHDMTLAPISRAHDNKLLNCSRCDSRETVSLNCYPIPVPADDPFFPATHNNGEPRCIPFTRSLIGQLTLGYRNQLNQLTAFVDGSQIYGSTECDANILRLFSMGRLNYTDLGQSNHEALPQGDQEKDCRSAPKFSCFRAGDGRSNEHPSLAVMHTIFLREHNRVATRLHRINNFWPDEKIYQEARRIVIAQYQHIVYNEFLPKILGCETAARYDLVPKKTGYYKGYDDRCDAGISHAFSTAAFRFGHTLIRPLFPRLDDFYNNFTTPLELSDVFNNPSSVYNTTTGGMDTLLMGLLGAPTMDFDRHISDAVRNRLFMHTGQKHSGMDLPAINMQRARDHGVPGYNSYRSLCGLKKAKTWDDLSDVMTPELIASFKSVYKHVDDIDLFPALMSETKMAGALVGPTTACIIAEQFQRTKRCDRFFYENDNAETRFTPDQLAEIRKASLAKIICGNNQFVRMLQPFVFDMPDDLV